MCYFVCSDIAHFGDKGKQKNQYHEGKQEKVLGSISCFFFRREGANLCVFAPLRLKDVSP